MPDGTVPSSTEALRTALSAARASLERQLRAARSDAADDALRQVNSALRLLPAERVREIPEIDWVEAGPVAAATAVTPDPLLANGDSADAAADDLTRIRGIDEVLGKRLAALGIQRFGQIAAWQPDDVRVIADAMGLGRRFIAMGIVEQAIELERAQAEARAKRDRTVVGPTVTGLQSVAVWEPKTGVASDDRQPADRDEIAGAEAGALVRVPAPWRPLAGQDLREVIAIIRMKRPMNKLVRLAEVAPVLNEPIYIATDHDAAIELPRWRTGVLVPFVEARETPDLTQLAHTAARARSVSGSPMDARAAPTPSNVHAPASAAAAHAIAAFHAAVAATPAAADVKVQPLHEAATNRINDLEAELEQWANARPPENRASPSQRPDMPRQTVRRVAEPPRDLDPPSSFGSLDDVAEADVKIVLGTRPKAPILAPLPELTLKARPRPVVRAAGAPNGEAVHTYGGVEEAAVVIVRRTADSAAAGLAFYAPPKPEAGPVRRFMRALAGG
jgi:predicted flap endonuclease-1-like 5' DNA nuclease